MKFSDLLSLSGLYKRVLWVLAASLMFIAFFVFQKAPWLSALLFLFAIAALSFLYLKSKAGTSLKKIQIAEDGIWLNFESGKQQLFLVDEIQFEKGFLFDKGNSRALLVLKTADKKTYNIGLSEELYDWPNYSIVKSKADFIINCIYESKQLLEKLKIIDKKYTS